MTNQVHYNLFPTPISQVNLGFHNEVPDELYDGWELDWSANKLKSNILTELKTQIDYEVNEYFKRCGWKPAELVSVSVCYTEMGHGEHLIPHHHQGSLVAWCYYIDVPEKSGKIGFIDPRGNTSWDFTDKRSPVHSILPKAGELIIFPGWLIHYVHPNLSTRNRITIAGDHNFKDIVEVWGPVYHGRNKETT